MGKGQSKEERDFGMKNSTKVEVNKGEGGILEEVIRKSEEIASIWRGQPEKIASIWKARRSKINMALVLARIARQQDQVEVDAHFQSLASVIPSLSVKRFISMIKRLAHKTDPLTIFNFQEPSGRSLLHVAARADKEDILRLLLHYVPDHLMASQDDSGDTPLHAAVKARAYGAALILIQRAQMPHVEFKEMILRLRNKYENTALHEAVLSNRFHLVCDLLKEDSEPVYWENSDHKSPLYLALDADYSLKREVFFSLPIEPSKIRGFSPVHGAILRSDYGLVAEILEKNMELFAMTDSGGGNVFHLAAYLNKPQVMELLGPKTEKLIREKDNNGDLPIHIASKMGHIKLIEKLRPASQLQNGSGQTILHVAAKYGRSSVVRYMLKYPHLGKLINERDHDGNTPLHLAAMHSQPAALIHLLLDEGVKTFLLNRDNLTAIDIALNRVRKEHTLRKLLAFTLLRSASAVSRDLILQKAEARDIEFQSFGLHMNLTKEVINSRLLVAVLVATVTFIAGFVVPGGFNGTETASQYDGGMATMLDRRVFQGFRICNTVAMFCSMIAVVNLLMAQQRDLHKAKTAFQHTKAPLAIALPAMSVAFLTGVTLTVGKLPWLAYAVLCLGVFGLLIVSGATLLEYPYFYRGHSRLIRVLTSWLVLAYIHLCGVETDISGDLEDDGKKELQWSASG